jgi:hypothetical protein
MATSELCLAHSLNKADYLNASSFLFYYDSYLLEIFKTAHGRVERARKTEWEFCRPPIAELPSSGLHCLRTRIDSHLRNSGRPGSR